jgi:hypothetical protein
MSGSELENQAVVSSKYDLIASNRLLLTVIADADNERFACFVQALVLQDLSEEEQEVAAQSSYRYFLSPTNDERFKHAAKMAERHIVAEKGNTKRALTKMRSTIAWRKDMRISCLRKCFVEGDSLGKAIEKELGDNGRMFVRGFDNEGRALFHIIPRHSNAKIYDEKAYIQSHVYNLERALACSEKLGAQSVIATVDFNGFATWQAPPIRLAKEAIAMMTNHYPERLHRVYLVDAPIAFRIIWAMLKPFIDPVTKKKFQFITGEEQKREVIGPSIAKDQAMRYLLADGRMPDEVDLKEFLYRSPFDKAIGEK